jgi:HEAT repeat protein
LPRSSFDQIISRIRPAPVSVLFTVVFLLLGCVRTEPTPSQEQTTALLTSLLQDENAEVRRNTVESLGKIGEQSAVAMVVPLLADQVPSVRIAAAKALGRLGVSNVPVIDALSHSLEDPDDGVKRAAAMAIGELEPPPAQLKPVVSLVQASDVRVKRAAIRALLDADVHQWVPLILPALEDPDAEVRQGAIAVLATLGNSEVRARIHKRFTQDSSAAVRAEAAYHMGELGGPETRSVLRAALKREPDEGVRRWIEAELRSLRASD